MVLVRHTLGHDKFTHVLGKTRHMSPYEQRTNPRLHIANRRIYFLTYFTYDPAPPSRSTL